MPITYDGYVRDLDYRDQSLAPQAIYPFKDQDVYQFTATVEGEFSLTLLDGHTDAVMLLLDVEGNILDWGTNQGSGSETILYDAELGEEFTVVIYSTDPELDAFMTGYFLWLDTPRNTRQSDIDVASFSVDSVVIRELDEIDSSITAINVGNDKLRNTYSGTLSILSPSENADPYDDPMALYFHTGLPKLQPGESYTSSSLQYDTLNNWSGGPGTYYLQGYVSELPPVGQTDTSGNYSDPIEITIIGEDDSYVAGSDDSEFVFGTFRDDWIEGKGGAFDVLFGGFGADVFVWGDEHLNDTFDLDVILDYTAGQDVIDTNTAEIAFSFDLFGSALIGFEGGDMIWVLGTGVDDLTLT